jgi:hypothetical protein
VPERALLTAAGTLSGGEVQLQAQSAACSLWKSRVNCTKN